MHRCGLVILGVVFSALLGPRRAEGTVLIPMSDAALVQSSTMVLLGTVLEVKSELRRERIVTRIRVFVNETVKGEPDGRVVDVTEPGGRVGKRVAWIFGAPRFTTGERVLLFLRRRRDGTLSTNGLALGKYRIEERMQGPRAVRTRPAVDVRALDGFLARVRTLATRGAAAEAGTNGPLTRPFTFLAKPGEPPARWFKVDRCRAVRLRLANHDVTLGRSASETAFNRALTAWTNVGTAAVVLGRGKPVPPAASVAGGTCDGVSTVQFNDPFDEVEDLQGCSGVLAVSGFCVSQGTKYAAGTRFRRILEGDVTLNERLGQCADQVDVTETLAHEIGHVLGLGHASEDPSERDPVLRDALMYAFAHHDGRGATLNVDDIAGLSTIYPVAAFDGDGDGLIDRCDECPATPVGSTVDASGCACGEAGHASCDDADPCTIDRCDASTAACVHDVIDCADDEPCTLDTCDGMTGQCRNVRKGDSDSDGVCDPIDPCPLQPHEDPADRNSDGVGDVCECAEPRPGRCIPGIGGRKRRCVLEFLPAMAPSVGRNGLPTRRLQCGDGEATCDDDAVAGQCTFRVAICVNNEDPRLPQCVPSSLQRLVVKEPKVGRPKDVADAANANALNAALDLAEQSLNYCSAFLPIVVPVQGTKAGSKRLKIRVATDAGRRTTAKLKLLCRPGPVGN